MDAFVTTSSVLPRNVIKINKAICISIKCVFLLKTNNLLPAIFYLNQLKKAVSFLKQPFLLINQLILIPI